MATELILISISDPYPPRNLIIEKTKSNSVALRWSPPTEGIVSSYVIRCRTESVEKWVNLPPVKNTVTVTDLDDLTPGEKYTIQVNTISNGVESPYPQQVNETIRPNPVSNIYPWIDSTNITLEWPRPEGRIEAYVLNWYPSEKPEELHQKNVSEANICKQQKLRCFFFNFKF